VGCLCDFVYGYFFGYFLWMDLPQTRNGFREGGYWIGDQGAKLDYQNKLLKNKKKRLKWFLFLVISLVLQYFSLI
jgi:hypothetical protein